jgi:hypothetical protein
MVFLDLKTITRIFGRSRSYAYSRMQVMKEDLKLVDNKNRDVTLKEFCEYFMLEVEEVEAHLKIKPKNQLSIF